ncbi:MAG: 16S rRNA (guanine(527)-N(7))-methyltransferase RsmG [Bacteroidetes bacterium]|nr:16S rRNA (guanine(527)-N(7))-methyltransferase RsmG [Bacteroidota bacterium]
MTGIDLVEKYFKNLKNHQKQQFIELSGLYEFWNLRINVISRKDISRLYERHVLPSLSIAAKISFKPGTRILDVGTGGGFPGIPLAIMFPETDFVLLDSRGKKIRVVCTIADKLELNNVKTIHLRAELYTEKFDFVVSRAVTSFPEFVNLVKNNLHTKNRNNLPNGIFYLTGGNIDKEVENFSKNLIIFDLRDTFQEPFFETKKLIYLPFE